MTNESVFPKVNGDILYASEVNRFSPKFIGNIIQANSSINSGTSYATWGTGITYPGAGSLQISDFMQIQLNLFLNNSNTVGVSKTTRIIMSGPGINNMVIESKPVFNQQNYWHSENYNLILTSGVITSSGGNIGSQYLFQPQILSNESASLGLIYDFTIIGY